MPILSVDYSLSPEAVYPQALNEAFFAYVWALNNAERLGSTGEKIVFCGDSAGANLMTSVTLKCIMCGVRLPDSVVVAYPPYRFDNSPTPSRILCLMDALLPMGILKACVQSYAGDPTLFTYNNDQQQHNTPTLHKYGSAGNLTSEDTIADATPYYKRSFSDSVLAETEVRQCTNKADTTTTTTANTADQLTADHPSVTDNPQNNEHISSDGSPASSADGTWEFVYEQSCSPDDESETKRTTDVCDPLMSPIFAADDLLLKLPHVSILACSLDPVFDDSVEFIRKLKSLGHPDANLHVVEHLPHGFLNFQPFSNEARVACDTMLNCVRSSLDMQDEGSL